MEENKSFGKKVLKGLEWFLFSYIWLFVIFFVVDIVTKQLVVKYFATHTDSIVLLGSKAHPFLQISYSINPNAAFGFGLDSEVANRVIYCVIASIGFSAVVAFYVWKNKVINGLTKAALMLIAVGALGNLVDRIFYTPEFLHASVNGVVDWIDFAGVWPFIFNIADSCVVIGTFMLIIYLIVDEIRLARQKRKEEVKSQPEKIYSKEELERMESSAPDVSDPSVDQDDDDKDEIGSGASEG